MMIMMIRHLEVIAVFCVQSICGQDGRCDGPLMCCRGFKYIEEENKCLPCQYPTFGLECKENCTCPKENCNMFKGCYTLVITKESSHMHVSTAVKIAELTSELTNNTTSTISVMDIMKSATISTIIGVEGSRRQMYFPYFEKPILFSVICLSMLLTVLFVLYILTCMFQKIKVQITIETMEGVEARDNTDDIGLYDIVHEY